LIEVCFLNIYQNKCVLSPPYGYAVDTPRVSIRSKLLKQQGEMVRYGATCFARRSANGLRNSH